MQTFGQARTLVRIGPCHREAGIQNRGRSPRLLLARAGQEAVHHQRYLTLGKLLKLLSQRFVRLAPHLKEAFQKLDGL